MKPTLVATALLLACCFAEAAPAAEPPGVPAEEPAPPAKKKMPMKADEPMKVPMAREGMMMGDVRESAAKKDAAMKKMMEQEHMPAPATPAAPK